MEVMSIKGGRFVPRAQHVGLLEIISLFQVEDH